MTAGLVVRGRHIGAVTLLIGLAILAVAVGVLTPQTADEETGGGSSRSAAPGGSRIVFELAQRMGWTASRRDAPLDSSFASAARPTRVVQVVIAPEQQLGAVEVHRLLDNVRRGGGLIFEIEGGGEIADSLGVEAGKWDTYLSSYRPDVKCPNPPALTQRATLVLPPRPHELTWLRPPPGPVTQIEAPARNRLVSAGASFPLGAGRVVVIGAANIFSNYAVRTCQWSADVTVARALEAVRPANVEHPRIVFDEYHHGSGAHGGSMDAVSLYLAHTMSGHFLAQAIIAALALLLAAAPRALVPREADRIPRRSPLEHADALAHAYLDVGATRTAAARLVSGLRRRAGRIVPVHAGASDSDFLDAVVRRAPSLSASAGTVRHALNETLPARDFVAVGDAIRDIEAQLSTPLASRS